MGRPSDGMTLEELREEYDWISEFQSRMAERITGDKDVHNLVDYVDKLEAENEKLRTFLGGCSIVTDYWKDEDGTMHVLTTDGEHIYEYMRGGLADENAMLREELDFCLKHVPNCDGCEAMLDCWECLRADSSQKERKRLDYENEKLRELVRDMWNGMCGYAHDCRSCEHYELYEGQRLVGECQYHARMNELGVEV